MPKTVPKRMRPTRNCRNPNAIHPADKEREVFGEIICGAEFDAIPPWKLYDYLESKCEVRNVSFPKLIALVRASNERGRWSRTSPNTSAHNGAFHMWCENDDGEIFDPHFKQFDGMCKMSNTNSREKVYHKWTEAEQKEKLTNLIPGIMRILKKNCAANNMPMEPMMAIIAINPQFRCCPMNAWCIKAMARDNREKQKLKICIGNMGFRSNENPEKIWWEY